MFGFETLRADRRDGGGFQGLAIVHGRQDARQTTGQQAFAGAGRAGEQQAMAAGRGDFQGAPRARLPAYLGEIAGLGYFVSGIETLCRQ